MAAIQASFWSRSMMDCPSAALGATLRNEPNPARLESHGASTIILPRPESAASASAIVSVRGGSDAGAVSAHRSQQDWALANGPCTIDATDSRIVTTLSDEAAGIRLIHTIEIDKDSDTITQRTSLTNIGETPLDVAHLSSGALPLPSTSVSVESFSGATTMSFSR